MGWQVGARLTENYLFEKSLNSLKRKFGFTKSSAQRYNIAPHPILYSLRLWPKTWVDIIIEGSREEKIIAVASPIDIKETQINSPNTQIPLQRP